MPRYEQFLQVLELVLLNHYGPKLSITRNQFSAAPNLENLTSYENDGKSENPTHQDMEERMVDVYQDLMKKLTRGEYKMIEFDMSWL
ncbi:hypothetical protein JTB14_029296 [Gonioctena quinquepunctata]|nr:hypothetical protein JTB14_029296 [Gonioctena quinquepunctata]